MYAYVHGSDQGTQSVTFELKIETNVQTSVTSFL